ncbi:MAG: hypothetical protein PHU71_00095 [Candidatus Gracilibacteria bacterium]|nr:hypothetical protein [Candidatus Gracilibacteria bacterium]
MTINNQQFDDLEKRLGKLPAFKPGLALRCRLSFSLWRKSWAVAAQDIGQAFRFSTRLLSTGFLALFVMFSSLTVYAYLSPLVSSSTPLLGNLKIASENVQLAFASNADRKLALQLSFAQKRVTELDNALSSGELDTKTVKEASYVAFEALQLAKQSNNLHTKVATAKNLAQISNQAAQATSQLKDKMIEEKASEKANAENLSEEVLREIQYRAQGIILGPSSVAANTEPSLELTPANKIVTKDLYVLANDPRRKLVIGEEELSEAGKLASQIINDVQNDPELLEVDRVLNELREKSDVNKVASELEILPAE